MKEETSDDPLDVADHAAVKVTWRHDDGGWMASLLAVDEEGFTRTSLDQGVEFDLELSSQRRCVGYHADVSDREPCPGFRSIDGGSQCSSCRRLDVFSGYVEGRTEAAVSGDVEFSVYIARIASEFKVGVTRSGKLVRRWVEQGADEAVEVECSLSSTEALELENKISSERDICQRVRKEDKFRGRSEATLKEKLDGLEVEVEGCVVDVSSQTAYPEPRCTAFDREGRFTGEIRSVKGQVVCFETGRCVAVGSGRVFRRVQQQGLSDY